MGMEKITERQVMGEFYKRLSQDLGVAWVPGISNFFESDQASEEYAFLGQAPQMRPWVGGRNAKGFRENSFTIKNVHYETTIEILSRNLRRDKTGQAMIRIQEAVQRTDSHWAKLLTDLIVAGESTACYDGQYFFDTDHEEGDSGAQSNDISHTLASYPADKSGSTTAPSVEDLQIAFARAIGIIASFVDDQGEPMNENATSFTAMVPVSYMQAALQAAETPVQVSGAQNALVAMKQKFSIEVVPNVRLDVAGWTTKFAMFRTDAAIKALIRQEETAVKLNFAKWIGSEYEQDNDAVQVGVDAWRAVDYGYWQNACLMTLA